MKPRRRRYLHLAAGAAVLTIVSLIAVALSSQGAWSQAARTIRIVVPYPPGSGPDILSRLMADEIGRAQGAGVVVENRPGGGTVIGTEAAARAAPDGNTVLLVANSFIINPALKKQNYDPSTSFEPICYLAATPMVLVVDGASPYRTLADLIVAARAKPGELSFASGGPASSLHVAIEVLKRAAGISVTYVPYPGTAPAINALLGNHVTAVFADYPTVVSHLQSGRLRGLVTASRARVEPLPDVPTFAETGVSKYEADIFYGIVAPAKTPSDMILQLSGWFSAALKAADVRPKLAKQGLFPVGTCGAEFGAHMRRQADEYGRIIHEANIKAE
jgi:tripartite-type tricarboxylate transporter receptor subunit TctC